MSKFQVIVIAIFVICIIAGVALFATYKSKDAQNSLPTVTIWGVFPQSIFTALVRQLNNTRESPLSINYVEKSSSAFDKEFIEALARGEGPDVILIPQEMMLRHSDKITPIPYSLLTERDFKNTYVQQAELYLTSQGIAGLPFTVDPLVMYWNRDLFTNAGLATHPRYWDEFADVSKKIEQKDVNSNIRRSAIAMGEFANISHAREILGTLFMQSGNPVTTRNDEGVQSTLGGDGIQSSSPAVSFFTQFANPRNEEYSWNRSLPLSKNWFLAGSLATYFGFSSELFDIREKNPNLDFDVSPLPQIRNGRNRVTYGSMYGLSIVRSSANQAAAYANLQALTAPDALTILGQLSYLPPVRRDMLATGSADPYQTIFYDSALISRGWLDMNIRITNDIFQDMIESITSGRVSTEGAIRSAHDQMNLSLQNP